MPVWYCVFIFYCFCFKFQQQCLQWTWTAPATTSTAKRQSRTNIFKHIHETNVFWWRIVCSVSGGDFFLPNHTFAVELISSSLNFMLWLAQIFHPTWWYFVYYDLHMSDWFLYTTLNICIIHIIIWDLSDFPDKIKQKNNANANIPVWINFNISRQCVVAVIRIRCFRALFSG